MRRFALVTASAIIASIIVGSAMELSLLLDPEAITPDWWFTTDTGFMMTVVSVILIGFGSWRLAENIETERSDMTQQAGSAAAAIAVFMVIWLVWELAATVTDLTMFIGVTLVVYAIIHSIWTYFQYRSQVTRADVAVRRTQGAISRDIRNMSAAVFGFIILSLSILAGVWSGLTTALPEIGDILLPFSGEFAYLGTVVMGYLAIAGSSFFGEMGAAEFATIALIIGALALVVTR